MEGARPIAPPTGLRPPMQVSAPQADGAVQSILQKPGAPALEDPFANQLDIGGQNSAYTKAQEATTFEKQAPFLSFWFTYHTVVGL